MSAFSDYAENKIVDHIFRNRSWTVPAAIAVALYTAAPGETGGGTEVTGGSYARVAVGPSDVTWNATQGGTPAAASSGTSGQTANAGAVTFPAPTANWGSIVAQGIHDATSGGNLLLYGNLTTPKTVNNADPAPSFAAGALTVTIA